MFLRKSTSDSLLWSKSVAADKWLSFYLAVSPHGMNIATTRLMPRPSFAMARPKLFEIPASSHLLSLFNEACTFQSFLWNVCHFHWCFPFLKMAEPFKNLSMAHGILSESHFSHIVCFFASFPQFLTKHNAHSLFHFLHHSNMMRTHRLPFFIWDHMRLREARVRVLTANMSEHALKKLEWGYWQQTGRDMSEHALKKLEWGYWQQTGWDMSEHALKKPRPWVPVHIGELIPIQILFVCTLYVFTLRFPDQNSAWIYYLTMCATYFTNLITVSGYKYKLQKSIIIWNLLQ